MPAAFLDSRSLLEVRGPDARAFLQGLLTSDVEALAPGTATWAALLSPQGKVLWDLMLHPAGDGAFLVECDADRADELARRLGLYRLRRAVEVLARTDLRIVVRWGGCAEPGRYRDGRHPALGSRDLVAGEAATNAAEVEWQRHRIALGAPQGAAELGIDRTLWLEANAVELNGVSFTKGCYVGQENTARMHHRDKLRRRLLPVAVDGDPGAARELMTGAVAAGEMRALMGDLGMAWLRLEHADKPLHAGEASVRVLWPAWWTEQPAAAD